MRFHSAISLLRGAIFVALLVNASAFALSEPAVSDSSDSLVNLSKASDSEDALVFVYLPSRTRWSNRKVSLTDYLTGILNKMTNAVKKAAQPQPDTPTDNTDPQFFKDRLDRNRLRPSISTEDEQSSPENTALTYENTDSSKSQSQNKDPGALIFLADRTNPNNILQKTSPNSNPTNQGGKVSSEQGTSFFSAVAANTKTIDKSYAIPTIDLMFEIVKSSQWDTENVVLSPFSVFNFLSLCMLGADGKTLIDLAREMNLKEPTRFIEEDKALKFHSAFQHLLKYLNSKSGKNVAIEIASTIYTDENYPPKQLYRQEALEYYDAPVNTINFETQGEDFKKSVNDWVSEKTHGKIQNIIEESPPASTTFAFINAVYFKGKWETPFVKQYTRIKDFFITPKETVPIKFMTNQLDIPYIATDLYQMALLPYEDKKTGLYILLPKDEAGGPKSLRDLEQNLTPKMLTESIRSMNITNVAIKIPKLSIKTDGQMKEVLTKMGLGFIFDPENANFTRLSEKRGLYISSVYHQACLDLDENGTEASAATAGIGDRIIDELPVTFVANKPFIFFIYNIRAQTILFWGRITKPQMVP